MSLMNDFFLSLAFGAAWSIPVAVTAIILPRGKALGLMNGIALIAILIALGLRIYGRVEGDISGYILTMAALQCEVVTAAALLMRLWVKRRIV